MQVIKLKIEDAFKLHELKSYEMYHACADRHYSKTKYESASESFSDFYKSLGISDYFIAERIANTVWLNFEALRNMIAAGLKTVALPFDLKSDYLERI